MKLLKRVVHIEENLTWGCWGVKTVSKWFPPVIAVCQLRACKYTHSSLGKLCWFNAEAELFPLTILLCSVKTTPLSPWNANNIQWITFSSLDQFPWVKRWGCIKSQRGPCWCARRPMRDCIQYFCALHFGNFSNYTVGQTGHTICTAAFSISGGTTGRCCCGCICAGEALQWPDRKRSHAPITAREKERLCCAITFLNGTAWTMLFASFHQQLKNRRCYFRSAEF